ncbi:MAG: hypothetical protein AVDCRST_MAG40-2453, partial [uncultured Gemmatimonadaceae bacterium]
DHRGGDPEPHPPAHHRRAPLRPGPPQPRARRLPAGRRRQHDRARRRSRRPPRSHRRGRDRPGDRARAGHRRPAHRPPRAHPRHLALPPARLPGDHRAERRPRSDVLGDARPAPDRRPVRCPGGRPRAVGPAL